MRSYGGYVPAKLTTSTRRIYVCCDFVDNSYVKDSYIPFLQSLSFLNVDVTNVTFENLIYHQVRGGIGQQIEISTRDDSLEICHFKDDHVFCLVHFRRKYKEVDPLATTQDSLRLCADVLGTAIGKEKDEEEEEKTEEEDVEEVEEAEEQEEHPDLLACRPCGLVFAHAWGLKDHQIHGYPVDASPTKRCTGEDDGVEVTYGYELECYLKDLPATVC